MLGFPLQVEGQDEVFDFGAISSLDTCLQVQGTDARLSSLTASERLNGRGVSASGTQLEAVYMLYLLPHWQLEMSHRTGICTLLGRCCLDPEECCHLSELLAL